MIKELHECMYDMKRVSELISIVRGDFGRRGKTEMVKELDDIYNKCLSVGKKIREYTKKECEGNVAVAKDKIEDVRNALSEIGMEDKALDVDRAWKILDDTANYLNSQGT